MPRPSRPGLVDAASRVKTPSGLAAFVFAVVLEALVGLEKGWPRRAARLKATPEGR